MDILAILAFTSVDRGLSVLGSTVIANYITMTTDSKTSIHRGKGQNMLFAMNRYLDGS